MTATAKTIETWHGFKYDGAMLEDLKEKISEAWGHVDEINEAYENLHGGIGTYTVCNLCGKIVKHEHNGFGSKCYQTICNILPKIAYLDENFKILLDNYNLLKWGIYAETIKKLYIDINSREDGTPKKFRNEFKKSFFESVKNNTSGRFSRKQIDVMLRDIEKAYNYNPELAWLNDIDIYNKNIAIYKLNPEGREKVKKAWANLLDSGDVIEFLQITYIRAWIDNPFKEGLKIEVDDN